MPKLSIGLDTAWQIAAVETADTGHEFIEPEHLFIGTCKLGQLTDENIRGWQLPNGEAASLKAEGAAVNALFQKFQLDHVAMYREIRSRNGKRNFQHKKEGTISRSPASRSTFQRAAELAGQPPVLSSLHLLAALLEDADRLISTLVHEKGVDAAAMKSAALESVQDVGAAPTQASFLTKYGKNLTQCAREGKSTNALDVAANS